MSDYSINSINSGRPAEAGTVPSRPAPTGSADGNTSKFTVQGGSKAAPITPGNSDQVVLADVKPAQTSPDSPAARLAAQAAQAALSAQEKADTKSSLPITNGDNVSIRFRVDRQTNNITVFIVDRISKRVLRSIPPEEVGKLNAGDLIEITG
jgi:hypothetical protein